MVFIIIIWALANRPVNKGKGFVLLSPCSNLANLLLARTYGPCPRFAVRFPPGASRMQFLRPLITEFALAGFSPVCLLCCCRTLGRQYWLSYRASLLSECIVFALNWHVFLGVHRVACHCYRVRFGTGASSLCGSCKRHLKSGAR